MLLQSAQRIDLVNDEAKEYSHLAEHLASKVLDRILAKEIWIEVQRVDTISMSFGKCELFGICSHYVESDAVGYLRLHHGKSTKYARWID